MMAGFGMSEVLSVCYNCDLDLSEDESNCDVGGESMPTEDQELQLLMR